MTPMRAKCAAAGFTVMEVTVVLALVAVLAALLLPVFARARERARTTGCQQHLVQIGMALRLYARDFDERFPPARHDLRPLLAGGWLPGPEALACPEDPLRDRLLPGRSGVPLGLTSSFRYRAGCSADDRPGLRLATDWDFWHADGANVLFLDGRVRWIDGRRDPLRPGDWVPVAPGPRPLDAE